MGDEKKICGSLLLLLFMSNMSGSVEEDQFSVRLEAPALESMLWDNNKCPIEFDEVKVKKLADILSQCSDYVTKSKWNVPNDKKINFYGTFSTAECHIRCLKHNNCIGFNWWKAYDYCSLLTEVGTRENTKSLKGRTSGLRNDCFNQGMDDEIYVYFSNPDKDTYEKAKRAYDGTNVTRATFSKVSANCLPSLVSYGHITEDQMGTAASVEAGESPYMPHQDAKLVTKEVNVSATGGPVRIWPKLTGYKNKNWATTGLYAKPGKLLTVTTPENGVGKITVQIGHLTDKLYNWGNKDKLLRDPQVVLSYELRKEKQIIGSPYGGMIFVTYPEGSELTGSINMRFENILEAPTFVLGRDSDQDWNNNIKNEKIPWTLIEVPQRITFVLPSSAELGVGHLVEFEKSLEEWKKAIDDMDAIAGINRLAPELYSTDIQILAGLKHANYPIMGLHNKHNGATEIFREGGLKNNGIAMGHEVGHNLMHPAYNLNHVMVNLYPMSLWPNMRYSDKKGPIWGREARLLGYILQGKPDLINSENKTRHQLWDESYGIWTDILRIPLDIMGFDTLPKILAPYKDFEIEDLPADMNEIRDLWVKNYCEVTQTNMLDFFNFWNINISEYTRKICETKSMPTNITMFMNLVESIADAENRNCPEGWLGYENKCIKITDRAYRWTEAQEACEEHNASLVSINNLLDSTWVQYIIMKSKITQYNSIWIGNVTNLSETFPFMENIAGNSNKQMFLGSDERNGRYADYDASCTYPAIKRNVGGKKTSCHGPRHTASNSKFRVMCEKLM